MEKAEPILTIAIPTYNGGQYIKDALDSVFSQLPINHSGATHIDILISDNASTDQTSEIGELYRRKYPNVVTYHRLPKNLHSDYNYDYVVRNAKGKYVWLVSDDDVLIPGGIQKVLDVIKKHKDVATIFANYCAYNGDLSRQIDDGVLSQRADALCPPGETYFLKTEGKNSLISSVIIKKEWWENTEVEKLIETGYVHFGVVLQVAAKAPSYIIYEPIVKMRCVKTSNRMIIGYFLGAQLGLYHIFKSLPRWGYQNSTADKAARLLHRKVARTIIVNKNCSFKFDKELLKKFFESYKRYVSFWVLDLPLIFLPTIFHKAVYSSYKKYQSVKRNFVAKTSCR